MPLEDPLEDFAAQNHQSLRRGAPAVDHPLRGVDTGKSAQPHGAVHHHGDRSAELRPPGAQPVEHGVSIACGVHGYGRPPADVDGRSRGIHRPSWIAGRAGGTPRPRLACPTATAAGWIPAARCNAKFTLAARRGERSSCSFSDRRHRRRRALALLERYRQSRSRCGC